MFFSDILKPSVFYKNSMRIVWFVLAVLLVCSCKKEKPQDGNVIRFDLEPEAVNIHSTALIKDCKIIPLETNDSVLIGEIDKVMVHHDRLYVGDFSQTNAIYIFDMQGKFLHKISRQGRGGEEYLALNDMFIDPHTGELKLLSRVDRRILAFSEDGKVFRGVQKMPKMFMEFVPSSSGYLGFSANYSEDRGNPFNIWSLDKDLKITGKEFRINPDWESTWSKNVAVFSNFRDTVCYIPAFEDFGVYKFDGDHFTLAYRFDFGKNQVPGKTMSYDEYSEYSRTRPDYVTHLYLFQETDRFLICQFLHNGQDRLGLYDKTNAQVSVCSLSPYKGKYFISFGDIVNFTSDYVVTSISAADMCEVIAGKNEYVNFEEDYPEQVKRMREEFPGIEEDSNPCVVIYSF